ncbi:Acetylserotonin O-methyltransferase 3-like [Zea mays]|uniref:Uncharacterized protein n=2 Tax=Zea mays TaxID=4577 RepID=B4FDN5_MAIZE|nr:Acetylserotonin O-methyltransferase 3-like [Zea mays]ACF80228.1 unknown [Zea mays]|eukprot:NP_001131705.1 uncharacterized protein LOC100193067 [Zea mays]
MFTRAELLEASVELRHHALGCVKSTALRCAVKLGVANAIQRRGGRASVEDLLTELSLDASRLRCLHSVMRALAALGVFKEGSDGEYGLTAISSLLVDDDSSVRGSLRPITLLYLEPAFVAPVLNLADWALAGVDGSDDDNNCSARGTAFKMTHGEDVWDVLARDAFLGDFFNGALASETRFLMDIAIRGSPQVFEGIASLVDAGGGTGAAAQAVAAAFPDTRCTVLELPQVVDAAPIDGPVRFVGGDMTKFIPPADAVLLKNVLHDWSDKDCVIILKRCKEAIAASGKVIVIDIVLGSSSLAICNETQLWLDLFMSTVTTGKERREEEWYRLFKEAGFSAYKISPVLGLLSIIEVFL